MSRPVRIFLVAVGAAIGLVVLTFAIALVAISIPNKARDANAAVVRGRQLVGDNQSAAALIEFGKALSLDPQVAGAHEGRAMAYLQMNMDEQALPELEMALKQSPKDASLEVFRGGSLSKLNRNEEALHAYTHAIALDPKSLDGLTNRALLATTMASDAGTERKNQLLAQAVHDCHTAEQAFPSKPFVYVACAAAFRGSGKLSDALAYANRAVALAPDNPVMYSARATVYGEMKDESHMTADFQEMQRLQRKQR